MTRGVTQLVGLVKDGLTPQLKIATKWAIGWLEAKVPKKISHPVRAGRCCGSD